VESEEPQRPFEHRKASEYIDAWVSTVAHPEVVWAWDAARSIIELYATLGVTRKKSLEVCRREQWVDWFASWWEGDAHFGIHGAVQELAHAIPHEHMDSFWVTLDHARQIGETGRMPTDDLPLRARPPGSVAKVEPDRPPAVVLKLVVNNDSNDAKPDPRQR
jgi:hypothetical protein